MTLGPFLFGAPLALLGLIALPVIWWVLRATPPTPKDVELPSMRLLDGVDPREETPARTPWWILLIRLAAAALALIGLSQPIYAPNAGNESAGGAPLLIVIDDGWESAPRWGEITGAADAALSTLSRDDAVHILTTADRSRAPNPAQRYTRAEAGRVLASLEPAAWSPNRDAAADRLEASGLRPARILWASNGLDPATAASFGQALSGLAPLAIYAAPPRGPAAMVALDVDAEAARGDRCAIQRLRGDENGLGFPNSRTAQVDTGRFSIDIERNHGGRAAGRG
ncbi:MAG: BatA domain-containing protein, partial [Pseudomonadota bacterium]